MYKCSLLKTKTFSRTYLANCLSSRCVVLSLLMSHSKKSSNQLGINKPHRMTHFVDLFCGLYFCMAMNFKRMKDVPFVILWFKGMLTSLNEWMMHLYSTLLCTVVHPKCFTIMGGGGGLSSTTTWMMRRLPRDNGVSALTTHQLQVERRESHRANQVYALTTHQLQVERRERVIESIKCMRSPHTSYRWRGERVIETIKCMRSPHTSYRWRGERES